MSVKTSYTLSEAQEMLTLWKACEKALASGQAKEKIKQMCPNPRIFLINS